jgi:argininosuccinate lyase
VEEVNKLVLQGVPFREAYKIIGEKIESGKFQPEKSVTHTHEGSIGNLCLGKIAQVKTEKLKSFQFDAVEKAINQLLS